MKNSFLIKALSLVLLCSFGNTWTMEENAGGKGKNVQKQKDKNMQKMLLMMGGSAAAYAAVHYFADKWKFPEVGNVLNVSRKGLKAGFTLTGSLAGLSMISNEGWSQTFRSAAMRVWLFPFLGAAVSHPKFQEGLQYVPFGLGQWFKENPPTDLQIGAIYLIGTYGMVRPTLDSVENRLVALIDKV